MAGLIFSRNRVVTFQKKTIISFYYLVAYALILFGYYKFIIPIYGYRGFLWEPNKTKILEGVLLTFIIPYILPPLFKKPSDIFLHLQLLFPIIPMFVLYGAESWPRTFLYYTVISFLLIETITHYASKFRIRPFRITKMSPIMFQRMLITLSWAVIGSILLLGGRKYLNFDFSRIYDFRTVAASNLPYIFLYISPLVSKVLLPFSLLVAVVNKDWLFALLSIIGSVMMFGLTAHKGPVFYPFIALALYFMLNKKNVIQLILLGYSLILSISIIDFLLEGKWVGSLMLRRVYLVPAQLNYLYYDFFSNNSFLLWSQSKITFGVVESPYSIKSSTLIASQYYGSTASGANTGWIGSGYMNAGFCGMLLYAIIIGFLMTILNIYSKFIDKRMLVAITIVPIFAMMVSSDLPTSFLNHGIFLILVFLSMLSIKNRDSTSLNTHVIQK